MIDEIIQEFGEDIVAEITGRKRRTVNGELVYRELSNNQEKELFNKGVKKVIVVSGAGSEGISLHDTTGKRRFHIITQLPWSAEQFVQQCGRTHRSNQESAPHYEILVTDLPGESRFMSVMLKRLRALGALTNGNRYIKNEYNMLNVNENQT